MKNVTKEKLKIIADKLMLDMEESQYDTLLEEFDTILKQMDLIGDIEGVDEITPMSFPYEITTSFLREDVPSETLNKDDALKNAKDVVDGQIRLPKVVG